MKKFEFKNYVTHKTAEVHVDVAGYEGLVFVHYIDKGEMDNTIRGCSEPGSGCKRFTSEPSAVRSAQAYVTKTPEQGGERKTA